MDKLIKRSITLFLLLIFSERDVLASEYKISQLGEKFDDPWSLAFISEDRFLLAELTGELKLVNYKTGNVEALISNVPDVVYASQGGLADVIIDDAFAENQQVYISYSARDIDQKNQITLFVARGRLVGNALQDVEVIFKAKAPRRTPMHLGAKMVILKDGTLLIASGDGYDYRENAQYLDNHFGKMIRINKDGSIPKDNPFINVENALPEIFSYGHRNMQGLLIDKDGTIWEHEHGPKGGDEINILEPGLNYGWPAICYCVDYSGAQITPFTEKEGMEQPLKYWRPSIAPSGFMLYSGQEFPEWQGDLFLSALASRDVRKVSTDFSQNTEEILFSELKARVRNIYEAPDGKILLLLDGPDGRIMKISK
tara:strand:+ start:269 stop:1375 length:1107 start_codon:yes stop_codon:yes gene_type:complete